ncbi:MAG: prepilin peptidase [Microgenomates group bacterium]
MLLAIYIGILGLCIGSFLNVLIDRLSNEEGIGGRSHCDHCKKQLRARDLVPVLSYILNQGECRYCKKHISFYYPIVEILTSVIFVTIYFALFPLGITFLTGQSIWLFLYLTIASSLIVIFFADLKYHIIPDEATIALLVTSILLRAYSADSLPALLPNLTAAVALTLTLFFFFFVTKGRGMGFGDVKLAFPMGFLLGLEGGFLALYVAFVMGGFVGLVLLLLRRKGLKSKLPFGPFLVLGTVAILVAGKPIAAFFHGLFGF